MIAHKGAKAWTKLEHARRERMVAEVGCWFCALSIYDRHACEEIHHLISGNKRMGHWYTLPLCKKAHDRMHDGTVPHSEQIDLWLKLQRYLGLDDGLPVSKIVPRRVA